MIDWSAVKAAYIATDKSYAQLGREYGVSASLVARHGRREDWPGLRAEHGSTEDVYKKLKKASGLLDDCIARCLEETEKVTSRETAELGRALKTALEIKRELQEQDKAQGAAQITVRFERPEWAE
ncbi:MAG: hypothetical protein IJ461_08570 [Clostridia bacterium]|nr:hypothetical protein [Clostridia bacterium]